METINPTTGERLQTFDAWSEQQVETALAAAATANPAWQATRAYRFLKRFDWTGWNGTRMLLSLE